MRPRMVSNAIVIHTFTRASSVSVSSLLDNVSKLLRRPSVITTRPLK